MTTNNLTNNLKVTLFSHMPQSQRELSPLEENPQHTPVYKLSPNTPSPQISSPIVETHIRSGLQLFVSTQQSDDEADRDPDIMPSSADDIFNNPVFQSRSRSQTTASSTSTSLTQSSHDRRHHSLNPRDRHLSIDDSIQNQLIALKTCTDDLNHLFEEVESSNSNASSQRDSLPDLPQRSRHSISHQPTSLKDIDPQERWEVESVDSVDETDHLDDLEDSIKISPQVRQVKISPRRRNPRLAKKIKSHERSLSSVSNLSMSLADMIASCTQVKMTTDTHELQAHQLLEQGLQQLEVGQYDDAIKNFKTASRLFRKNCQSYLMCQFNVGLAQQGRGTLALAHNTISQVFKLAKRRSIPREKAQFIQLHCLIALSEISHELEQIDDHEEVGYQILQHGIKMYDEIGCAPNERIVLLHAIGDLLCTFGHEKEGIDFFNALVALSLSVNGQNLPSACLDICNTVVSKLNTLLVQESRSMQQRATSYVHAQASLLLGQKCLTNDDHNLRKALLWVTHALKILDDIDQDHTPIVYSERSPEPYLTQMRAILKQYKGIDLKPSSTLSSSVSAAYAISAQIYLRQGEIFKVVCYRFQAFKISHSYDKYVQQTSSNNNQVPSHSSRTEQYFASLQETMIHILNDQPRGYACTTIEDICFQLALYLENRGDCVGALKMVQAASEIHNITKQQCKSSLICQKKVHRYTSSLSRLDRKRLKSPSNRFINYKPGSRLKLSLGSQH